jgi:hypothetical protein
MCYRHFKNLFGEVDVKKISKDLNESDEQVMNALFQLINCKYLERFDVK